MPSTETSPPATDERALIEQIRAGDERAFAALVDEYSPSLLGVAMNRVSSRAVAEEVVQETWVGVMRGLDRFEGRSSLRSWIFAILRNTAISKGEREQRTIPMSSLGADFEDEELGLEPDRFLGPNHDLYPGHWALGPTSWPLPDEGLLAGETKEVIVEAINELPPSQRTVITLRDVEGWDSDDVCEMLNISA